MEVIMAANKPLYVRVHLKTGSESFYRCAIRFTREWQKLDEVDEATARRLKEEQMLEVSEDVPVGYTEPSATLAADTPAADAPSAPAIPADPAERALAIQNAIDKLDKADAALWTGSGSPTVTAIVAITGWQITAIERDAAWAELNKAVV